MDEVLRAIAVYGFLLVVFRITGQRSVAQTTAFDLILLLILSEALQNALVDDDSSVTAAMTVVLTLVVLNIALSELKQHSHRAEKLLEGVPIVIVEDGKPLLQRMERARIDIGDVLAAARMTQGIDQMDQIRLAVLERSGSISVMPR